MRLIFLVLILSTFSYSLQDAMCTVPSGYTRVLDTSFNIIDYTDSRTCNTFTGTKYNCYGTSDKELIYENLETLPNGLCNYHMIEKQYKYVKDCGTDAVENPNTHLCECSIPSMIYDDTSNSCSCPSGQIYNGDYCENSCSPMPSPYQVNTNISQSECNINTLQTLYNQNNTDGRIISDAQWNCDNKCYFTINSIPDNNTTTDTNTSTNTDNNTTTGTSTNTDTNISNTNVSNDGSILAAINNSNVHLGQVNTNLGTISGRIKVAGDINKQETKYQGDRLHDDIKALQNQLDNSQSNLESALARLNETNLRGFAGLGTSTGNDNNGSGFDGNITVDLNDSRIVEANNNTTIAINDLKNMDRDKVDDTLSYLDELNSTFSDFTSLISDLNSSLNSISSSFTNVYHPNIQHYNSGMTPKT